MKVEVEQKEKQFEPIRLVITIDTQEEFDVFKSITFFNRSIPDLFIERPKREVAYNILNCINIEITKK